MRVEGENYSVTFDADTVICVGELNLRGKEGYGPIAELLDSVVAQNDLPRILNLDLRRLAFLNSSGITTLGGFIIKVRNKGGVGLKIICSNDHAWQGRSIKGLQKLMNGLEVVFE